MLQVVRQIPGALGARAGVALLGGEPPCPWRVRVVSELLAEDRATVVEWQVAFLLDEARTRGIETPPETMTVVARSGFCDEAISRSCGNEIASLEASGCAGLWTDPLAITCHRQAKYARMRIVWQRKLQPYCSLS
jgi:hypothetical protein